MYISFFVIFNKIYNKILWILVCVYLLDLIIFINSAKVLQELAAFLIAFSKPSFTSGNFLRSAVDNLLIEYKISFSNFDISITYWLFSISCINKS